jgi:hypothetical protein
VRVWAVSRDEVEVRFVGVDGFELAYDRFGTGHFAPVECPGVIAEEVRAFLA